MEPRYHPNWVQDVTFIGGFERFDLFMDGDDDLRIVWGATDPRWHFIKKGSKHFSLTWTEMEYGTLTDPPSRAELNGIRLYLKLFCPDIWAELNIGGTKHGVEEVSGSV